MPDSYAYIAAFDGVSWRPIDYGEAKNNKASFHKMGRDILYIALSFDGNSLKPASYPFILHKNGEVECIVADTTRHRSVELRRKYPASLHVVNMYGRILDGKIQAANRRDFSDSTTIYTIKSFDDLYQIPLDTTDFYRYWRYLAPEGAYGNISELVFFDSDGQEIRGKILGTKGDDINEISKAFDQDWLTCYDTWTQERAWVGMDFGKPVKIEEVQCVPRSDDNYIHLGDEYELKYWDNEKWQSLGKKIADDTIIEYDGMPEKALLWLSNLSRGKQERIFVYDEAEQVWW